VMKPSNFFLSAFLTMGIFAGLICIAAGMGIELKAEAAQILLRYSWFKSQKSGEQVRPWPWFDGAVLGRLTVDRLGVDLIILEGDSGAILAFGPGRNQASAQLVSEKGNCVLSGHRDTSFAFLQKLIVGDIICIESGSGRKKCYSVKSLHVIDRDNLYLETEGDLLTLITCYPFEAVMPGSEKRYVVSAVSRI